MIPFAEADRLTLFLLVAMGLTIAILLMRAHRYLARQRSDDQAIVVPRPPRQKPDTRLMDGPPELAQWELEMHQTARNLAGEIDSRVSVLRAMVAEADRAAARLEAALGKRPTNCAEGWKPPRNTAPTAGDDVGQSDATEAASTLADYGFPSDEIAARLGRPIDEIERILRARKRS